VFTCNSRHSIKRNINSHIEFKRVIVGLLIKACWQPWVLVPRKNYLRLKICCFGFT